MPFAQWIISLSDFSVKSFDLQLEYDSILKHIKEKEDS